MPRLYLKGKTLVEKIHARTTVMPSGCWNWNGSILKNGYGCLGVDGKTQFAHRASFLAFHGSIPEGKDICHSCDNRACVNPAHLFSGSRKDNMQDCAKKGRTNRFAKARGSRVATSILNESDVSEILVLLSENHTCAEIGRKFNVSRATISKIKNKKNWRHITQ
jgi:hypothetical protein